jgi:hypothetical protein
MITATCHCGAVRIDITEAPKQLTDCNCSLCRRLGGLWAYYTWDQVAFVMAPDATAGYAQGDKTLATHHCRTCGCTTHWVSLDPENPERVAVNARLFSPEDRAGIRVRKFDGADTWAFLD